MRNFLLLALGKMTKLSDTYFLKRAGSYSNPLNSNQRLPIIYGNLTDGIAGNWELPCLNATDWVYAYAGSEVLSVANGNTIVIYENGLVLTSGGVDYTFNAANNYEGHGTIATIDMVNPKLNAIITATGKGKPTAAAGATLMENIIDIVNDFLTVENDFTSALYEATAKATAAAIFTGQSYKAAGAIVEDVPIWETIMNMMGSFLGSAFINGQGELILDIDVNTIPLGMADIIPKGDAFLTDAKIKRDNIINQCPCNYAYSYTNYEFKKHTDATAHADAISQSVFGMRTPSTPYQFYWCRDLTSVQKVQDYIVAKLKNPIYEIEITDATLKRVGVDIGDFIAWSADSLYGQDGIQLLNNFWKIISVRPDYGKNNIVFRALQTDHFLMAGFLLDGSWILDGSKKLGGGRDTTIY